MVVVAWAIVLVVFAPLGSKLPDETKDEFARPAGSQSAEVHHLLETRFAGGDLTPVVLVYQRAGGLTPGDEQAIVDDATAAANVPLVGRSIPPFGPGAKPGLVSRDRQAAYTILSFASGGSTETKDSIDRLRSLVQDRPGLEAHVTGTPALLNDFTNAVKEADVKLLLVTGLLVLTLLILIYRSPILALLPIVVVGISYAIANGIVYLLARAGLSISSSSTSLLLVLMFGLGTDYCLLLVGRYSGQLRRTEDRHDALAVSVPRAAPAIVASGATVVAALLVLLASVLSLNKVLGPVNAIGVAVVLLASLTLLPALLAVFGRSAFWPSGKRITFRLPDLASLSDTELKQLIEEERETSYRHRLRRGGPAGEDAPQKEAVWLRFGKRVLQRPAAALVASVFLLGACSAGLVAYKTNADVLAQFRTSTDGKEGYELLRRSFPPGITAPTTVLAERRDGPFNKVDFARVAAALSVPGVAAFAPQSLSRDRRIESLALVFSDDPYGYAALDRVASLRHRVRGLTGLHVILGDGTANRLDFKKASQRDFKLIAPLVLLVILATLILLLRAVVAPLYLLATVILSFLGTLGLSILAFKYLFGQDSFDPELPVFAFIFLVALGSDYNIFLMSRVREEAAQYGTREGSMRALSATGPVITSAGLILAGTFAALTVIPIYFLLELGFAVALGVLLDTFLVRTIVVPACAGLVGERSWWPFRAPLTDASRS